MADFEGIAAEAQDEFELGELAQTVGACRSYRRFDEADRIPKALLLELVNLARQTASGANRQPLRYRVVVEHDERAQVFAQLKWAGALRDWDGPEPGECPSGYIVICDAGGGATTAVDEGIAAQTILLAATQAGYGGCMLHAFNRAGVAEALGLAHAAARLGMSELKPLMVIALGRPAEQVRLEPMEASPDGSTTYWRSADGVHHVPKLSVADVLV